MDDATAQKMLASGKQVSVYYQGDKDSKKGWRKIEPIRIEGEGDDKVMVAYEIEGSTNKPPIKRYIQKKIINWNVLSTVDAKFAKKEKEKDQKTIGGGKKKVVAKPEPVGGKELKISKRNLGDKGDDFCEAILNKRVGKMYYKGDKENQPGWRMVVQLVCYGSKKGVKYVRAWVGSGKSVSGEKNPEKKALPGWRFFREDRIEKWEVYGTFNKNTFNKTPDNPVDPKTDKAPDSNFNPNGDELMDTIFCISNFSQTPNTLNESSVEPLKEESILSTIKEAINIF